MVLIATLFWACGSYARSEGALSSVCGENSFSNFDMLLAVGQQSSAIYSRYRLAFG